MPGSCRSPDENSRFLLHSRQYSRRDRVGASRTATVRSLTLRMILPAIAPMSQPS